MDKRRTEGFLLGCLLFVTAAVFFFLGAKYSLLFSGSPESETSFVIHHGTTPTSAWPTTTTAPPPSFSVDINTVTAEELQRIPGIGETFAQRIVAYRDKIGGFTSLEQLKEVQGIGDTRYSEWSVYFTLN